MTCLALVGGAALRIQLNRRVRGFHHVVATLVHSSVFQTVSMSFTIFSCNKETRETKGGQMLFQIPTKNSKDSTYAYSLLEWRVSRSCRDVVNLNTWMYGFQTILKLLVDTKRVWKKQNVRVHIIKLQKKTNDQVKKYVSYFRLLREPRFSVYTVVASESSTTLLSVCISVLRDIWENHMRTF